MTARTRNPASPDNNDLQTLPSAVLAQWRAQADSSRASNDDPSAILEKRDAHMQRLAALEAFMAIDRMRGLKYAKGISYLFAMHVDGQSADDIARAEKTTPEKIYKAAKDAGAALRPVLASFNR